MSAALRQTKIKSVLFHNVFSSLMFNILNSQATLIKNNNPLTSEQTSKTSFGDASKLLLSVLREQMNVLAGKT